MFDECQDIHAIWCSSSTREESCTRKPCVYPPHHASGAFACLTSRPSITHGDTFNDTTTQAARTLASASPSTVSRHDCPECPESPEYAMGSAVLLAAHVGQPVIRRPLHWACPAWRHHVAKHVAAQCNRGGRPIAISRMPDLSKSGAFPPSLHGLFVAFHP